MTAPRPILTVSPTWMRVKLRDNTIELLQINDDVRMMENFKETRLETFPYGFAIRVSNAGENTKYVRKYLFDRLGLSQQKLNFKLNMEKRLKFPIRQTESPWDNFSCIDNANMSNVQVYLFRSKSLATEIYLTLHGTEPGTEISTE